MIYTSGGNKMIYPNIYLGLYVFLSQNCSPAFYYFNIFAV